MPQHVARAGVPKSFWVYGEESQNGQLKNLFNVCSKGWSVEQQILLRLEWSFSLRRRFT
jgi:hypothetical protein